MVINQVFSSPEFEAKLEACIEKVFSKKIELFLRQIEENSGRIHDLEVSMDKTQKTIEHLQDKVCSLEEKCNRLLQEINELEQYSRRNCLRIFGIEEKRDENTDTIITEIATKHLGFAVNPTDIDRSHRIGRKDHDNGKPRAIIVKFSNYEGRNRFIKNRRKLKGTDIIIKEDLTKTNQELLQNTKKNPAVKSAWSHDGKIIALINKNGSEFTKRIWGPNDLKHLQ